MTSAGIQEVKVLPDGQKKEVLSHSEIEKDQEGLQIEAPVDARQKRIDDIFSALQKNEEYLRRSEELAREWGDMGAVRVHLEKERKELLALLEGEQSARETAEPSRAEVVGQLLADRDPQPSERLATCFPLWKQLGKTEDIERLLQGISIKDIPPPEIQRNDTEQEREARTVAYLAEKQKILSQKIDRRFGSHPIVHISIGSLGRKLSESSKAA